MLPRSALHQAVRRPVPSAARHTPRAVRWNSSTPSAYSSFFKQFGRPLTKVSLMAIFTYQLVFFAWTKLDTDDIRNSREELEAKVRELQASKKA